MDHMTASCRLLPQSRKWSDAHCRRSTWFCLHWRLICGCLVCILYCILCNAFRSPCWVNDQHTSAYNWSIVTGWSVPLPDQLCTDCGITVHTVYGVHTCLIPRDSTGFLSHTLLSVRSRVIRTDQSGSDNPNKASIIFLPASPKAITRRNLTPQYVLRTTNDTE